MLSKLANQLTLLYRDYLPIKSKNVAIYTEGANWSLDHDARELKDILQKRHYDVEMVSQTKKTKKTVIFYPSIYLLLQDLPHVHWSNRLTTAWFHGQSDEPEFLKRFNQVSQVHPWISRIQVTNQSFKDYVLKTGITPSKVKTIPIGIQLSKFHLQTQESCQKFRQKFNIPLDACVIGSFQKDGVGWEEGLEPKMIKGPDIFLKVISQLKQSIPHLFVLLTGPARGFVKKGLNEMGIRWKHFFIDDCYLINNYYQTLDAYIVTSRDEGGPKSILESMATGVPIISTRVGQAQEIIQSEINGFLSKVDDVNSLTHQTLKVIQDMTLKNHLTQNARQTSKKYDYNNLADHYTDFFDNL